MAKKARKRAKRPSDEFKWHDHPRIAGRTFLTLPKDLLTAVTDRVGQEKFDRDVLKLDEDIAAFASKHPGLVGFIDGWPIAYQYLNIRTSEEEILSVSDAERMGWTKQQVDAVNGMGGFVANQHNLKISYCGWLMLKHPFRSEHDDLVQTHANVVGCGPPVFTQQAVEDDTELDGEQSDLMDRWRSFYSKWRINKLVAPGLPDPAGVQWTDLGRDFTPDHLRESTRGPKVSDIQMLPGGDTLRELMADLSPIEEDWHLRDWKRLIDPSNPSKNQIDRYARLFRLQHYWKVLFDRHSNSLNRQIGKLELAFANYLGQAKRNIHDDLQLLRHQLGHDWFKH